MVPNTVNSRVGQRMLETHVLRFQITITGNATPASKTHATDLDGIVYLRTEGKVADADAIEDLSASFTTADDNDGSGNSEFGILIKGSELAEGGVAKVRQVRVEELTALATSIAITDVSDTKVAYKTAGGNIAIEVAGTGLNLASESPTFFVEVIYDAAI